MLGGIYHALIGTLLITLLATIISVPVGLLTAIYLVEYGKDGALARGHHVLRGRHDRHPLDRRRPVRRRAASSPDRRARAPRPASVAAVALSVLMIPVVVRSSEEMLKIVPERTARGRLRPGRAQVADHPQGGHPDGDLRHRLRRHPGHRPRHRRDRADPGHRRLRHQHQLATCSAAGWPPCRRSSTRQILNPTSPTNPDPSSQRAWARGPGADHPGDAAEPGRPPDRPHVRPQDRPLGRATTSHTQK